MREKGHGPGVAREREQTAGEEGQPQTSTYRLHIAYIFGSYDIHRRYEIAISAYRKYLRRCGIAVKRGAEGAGQIQQALGTHDRTYTHNIYKRICADKR